jgi:short-subunit dehydrogenase
VATFLPLQLDDLASVRACASKFLDTGMPLHLLINNAGLAGAKGLTKDGFELAFGVNHMGHFSLTHWLLPRLKEADASRVVTVASRAHWLAKDGVVLDRLRQPTASMTGVPEYAVSKLANVLFTRPGVVDTEVWREVPRWLRPLLKLRGMLTPEQGAETTLHCALSARAEESGLYFDRCRVKTPSFRALEDQAAKALWTYSKFWTSD